MVTYFLESSPTYFQLSSHISLDCIALILSTIQHTLTVNQCQCIGTTVLRTALILESPTLNVHTSSSSDLTITNHLI